MSTMVQEGWFKVSRSWGLDWQRSVCVLIKWRKAVIVRT